MSDSHNIFSGRRNISPFGSEGSSDAEFNVDLNLTPLMDVMANILFFLLAGFGAAILSFLAASVPVQSENESGAVEPPKDKVTMQVRISEVGLETSASAEGVAPEKLAELKKRFERRAEKHDFPALTAFLAAVKKDYPQSDTIMILPSDTTIYEEIVETIAASKDTKLEKGRLRLFPKAVVADLVKNEGE